MTLSALKKWRMSSRLLSLRREGAAVTDMVDQLGIRPSGMEIPFGVLSGGNKQKVIFARALLRAPKAYVLCEPTRGVDVTSRGEIYSLIRQMRDSGAGVLIVTSDDHDLFAVCDRIGVVEGGRVGQLRPVAEMNIKDLEALV